MLNHCYRGVPAKSECSVVFIIVNVVPTVRIRVSYFGPSCLINSKILQNSFSVSFSFLFSLFSILIWLSLSWSFLRVRIFINFSSLKTAFSIFPNPQIIFGERVNLRKVSERKYCLNWNSDTPSRACIILHNLGVGEAFSFYSLPSLLLVSLSVYRMPICFNNHVSLLEYSRRPTQMQTASPSSACFTMELGCMFSITKFDKGFYPKTEIVESLGSVFNFR